MVVSKDGKHIYLASFEPSQLRIIHDALRKVIKRQEPPPAPPVETSGGEDGEANDFPETEQVGNGEGGLAQAPGSEKDGTSVEEVTEAFGACKVVVKHEDTEAAIKRGSFCMLDSWD